MGLGRRLVLALTVVAVFFGMVTMPQLPAQAAPVAFEHVFSDGDPLPKVTYEIPDLTDPCHGNDFVFRQGAYVLLISASVAAQGSTAVVPSVSGKGLTWNVIHSQPYTAGGASAMFAVHAAWADNPETNPATSRMTFDFNGQSQALHTRTFIQTTASSTVSRTNTILQAVAASGTGSSAQVGLQSFEDQADGATVLGVVKHSNPAFSSWSGVGGLSDTTPGPGNCVDGTRAHRIGAGAATGQVLAPSATWGTSSQWRAVAFQINGGGGGNSTTTTQATTPTTQATTTTTTEATTTTTTEATTTTTTEATTTTTTEGTTTTTSESETTTTTEPGESPTTTVDPGSSTTTVDPGSSTTTTTPGETPTTTVVGADPTNLFVDDDHSEFEADIELIAQTGISLGCNPPVNDMFCPDDTLTRGQMAAFLARALGLTGDPDDRFTDDDTSVFETEIGLVAEAGIARGCNPPANNEFCPEDTLSRGQMAAFIARALELTGDPDDRFTDDDSSVFETEIGLVAEAGIARGCNPPANNEFCPEDTLNRGQMAAFLARMLYHLAG